MGQSCVCVGAWKGQQSGTTLKWFKDHVSISSLCIFYFPSLTVTIVSHLLFRREHPQASCLYLWCQKCFQTGNKNFWGSEREPHFHLASPPTWTTQRLTVPDVRQWGVYVLKRISLISIIWLWELSLPEVRKMPKLPGYLPEIFCQNSFQVCILHGENDRLFNLVIKQAFCHFTSSQTS